MKEKLILIIEQEIKKQQAAIKKENESLVAPMEVLKEQLQQIIDNPLAVATVDIDAINSNIKSLDEETIKKIKLYQKLTSLVSFPLLEEQKNEIKQIMLEMHKKLEGIIEIVKLNSNPKTKEYEQSIERIVELKNKITNNVPINSRDLDLIVNLIADNNIELDDRISLITELTLKTLESLKVPNNEPEEDIIEIVETNLDRETVIGLFRAFGINFDDFDIKEQNKIIKYGNLERMEGILNVFRENHIYLNVVEKSGYIQEILIHSNAEIVATIINNVISDIKNGDNGYVTDLNKVMQSYINNPSLFIMGKRNYKRKTNGPSPGPGPGGGGKPADVIGAYQNYIDNRQTFIEIGINMKNPSTATISMLSFSNRKIKENIANYDFYGVPRELYAGTISCLKATDSLSTMDQYIECGYQRYMLNNLSMVNRRHDDIMFYRMVKALQMGISHDSLYYNKDKPMLYGEITNPSSRKFGITEENKVEEVKQYLPEFTSKYDEIINSSKNGSPLTLVYKDELIKKLEVYKEDDLRYNFNGVIISRLKVLRFYETLLKASFAGTVTSIKYVVTKNSILTEGEYRNIESCLDKIYAEDKGVGPR